VSALSELPALAVDTDWLVDTAEPDVWGDVRTKAIGDGGTITLVFADTGKLAGGYFADARGRMWHTERVVDVKRWLESRRGGVD